MRQRVVPVGNLTGRKEPGVIGVDGLVVMEGPVAEIPESGYRRRDEQADPDEPLHGQPDPRTGFLPGTFFSVGNARCGDFTMSHRPPDMSGGTRHGPGLRMITRQIRHEEQLRQQVLIRWKQETSRDVAAGQA